MEMSSLSVRIYDNFRTFLVLTALNLVLDENFWNCPHFDVWLIHARVNEVRGRKYRNFCLDSFWRYLHNHLVSPLCYILLERSIRNGEQFPEKT